MAAFVAKQMMGSQLKAVKGGYAALRQINQHRATLVPNSGSDTTRFCELY